MSSSILFQIGIEKKFICLFEVVWWWFVVVWWWFVVDCGGLWSLPVLVAMIICMGFLWILYTNWINSSYDVLFLDQNWCIYVYKMYPTFQWTFAYILYTKFGCRSSLNFAYKMYTKVKMWDTFCIHQLCTSSTIFVW